MDPLLSGPAFCDSEGSSLIRGRGERSRGRVPDLPLGMGGGEEGTVTLDVLGLKDSPEKVAGTEPIVFISQHQPDAGLGTA